MVEEQKWRRIRKAAKHVVAAVVFMESSHAAMAQTKGSLLACIGYYYASFHASMAMLCLALSVAEADLRRIRHSELKRLVEEHLVHKRDLDKQFLIDYQLLQDLREYANYKFGSKRPEFEFSSIAPKLPELCERMLLKMRENVHARLEALDMTDGLKMVVGDDIGSDLIKLHCGLGISEHVWDYLVSNNLTT